MRETAFGFLGEIFHEAIAHITTDDKLAEAFDAVCIEMTKRMDDGERYLIIGALNLDIANPWKKFGDQEGYRRPVELRRKNDLDWKA